MTGTTRLKPPPPDVADRWLDEPAPSKPSLRGRVATGVGQARHRGRGGRWIVWLARMTLWAGLGLLVLLGARSLVYPVPSTTAPAPQPSSSEPAFPVQAAEAFAVRFSSVYLEWDSSDPRTRAERLAAYIPEGADQQLGWGGNGTQVAVLILPVRTNVISERSAVVTVAAEVTGVSAPRWVHLSVPVYTDGRGRFVVTDVPALVPAPGEAEAPRPRIQASDSELADALREPLTAFFRGYAGGGQGELEYLLAPGVDVGTLGGTVRFESLRLSVPEGGDRRDVTAEVRWADPVTQSTFTQTYQVTVAQGQDGRWYIERLGAHAAATSQRNQEK